MLLSERIRKCAELVGSGDELARRSAVPRSSLETYVTGKAEPKAGRIAAICYASGVNGHWLLTGDGPMLLADLQSEAAPPLVDPGLLEGAISAIDKIAAERGLLLSNKKRAKLVALLYQYYLLDKAEGEATAYLSQLMELVSNN